jgi:hypothetical protein
MSWIIFLEVPDHESEEAKSLGARQHAETGQWYISGDASPELDIEPFERWMPDFGSDGDLRFTISAPIYVAESTTSCRSCGCRTRVIALAVEEIPGILEDEGEDEYEDEDEDEDEENGGLILLHSIEDLPREIAGLLSSRYPFLKMRPLENGGPMCLQNTCSCGALLPDISLQSEPDGGFFPGDEEEAAGIVLRELPVSGPYEIQAGFGRIVPDLIGSHARREPFWEGTDA